MNIVVAASRQMSSCLIPVACVPCQRKGQHER